MRRDEADQLLALAERAEPLEVVQENGVRVIVPPLTLVRHDGEPDGRD